jgi:hypothetical protein
LKLWNLCLRGTNLIKEPPSWALYTAELLRQLYLETVGRTKNHSMGTNSGWVARETMLGTIVLLCTYLACKTVRRQWAIIYLQYSVQVKATVENAKRSNDSCERAEKMPSITPQGLDGRTYSFVRNKNSSRIAQKFLLLPSTP